MYNVCLSNIARVTIYYACIMTQVNNDENKGYLINLLASFCEHLPSDAELEDGCLYNYVYVKSSCGLATESQRHHAFFLC